MLTMLWSVPILIHGTLDTHGLIVMNNAIQSSSTGTLVFRILYFICIMLLQLLVVYVYVCVQMLLNWAHNDREILMILFPFFLVGSFTVFLLFKLGINQWVIRKQASDTVLTYLLLLMVKWVFIVQYNLLPLCLIFGNFHNSFLCV